MVSRSPRRCAAIRDPGALATGAAGDGTFVLRFPRKQARGRGLLPPDRETAGDAAKLAQHVPPHGADKAGRAHLVGHDRAARRRAASEGADEETRAAEEADIPA